MKLKLTVSLLMLCLVGLVVGFVHHRQLANDNASEVRAMGNWADIPTTLTDLYRSADLIVRVRIVSSSSRLLTQTLPIYGPPSHLTERAKKVPEDILLLEKGMDERGIKGRPDQLTQQQAQEILAETTLESVQIGEEIVHTPFTDFKVEVLEVFKGVYGKEVIVMQLGGQMPALNLPQSPTAQKTVNMQFGENPLLKVGEEYILYLLDSRNNTTHAQGRELYELVGPTGQFRIINNRLYNPYSEHEGLYLPTKLNVLQQQLSKPLLETDMIK